MDSVLRRVFILNWKWAAFGMTALRNWHLWWGCFEVARFLFTMTGSMLPRSAKYASSLQKLTPSSLPFLFFYMASLGHTTPNFEPQKCGPHGPSPGRASMEAPSSISSRKASDSSCSAAFLKQCHQQKRHGFIPKTGNWESLGLCSGMQYCTRMNLL